MAKPYNRNKKESWWNKKNIVSLFIVLIMVSSLLALWEGSSNDAGKYGDYKFTMEGNGMYSTEINDEKVYFFSLPDQISGIEIAEDISEELKFSDRLYFLFNPKDENIEVIEVLRRSFAEDEFPLLGKNMFFGVSEYDETYSSLPVYNCENATMTTILMETREDVGIYREGGCIVLSAKDSRDLFYVRDRLLFDLFEVIE